MSRVKNNQSKGLDSKKAISPVEVDKTDIRQAIIANSNIKETLDTYPELKQVLVGLSPKFKRMQNAAVYNTLARFANFNDAAKITGLSVCEILHTINRQLGTENKLIDDMPKCITVDPFDVETNSVAISWDENTSRYIYSEKTMSKLIQKVIKLAPQQSMVIISVDQPNELLKIASGLDYRFNVENHREYRSSIFNPLPEKKESSWSPQKSNYEALDARVLDENPFDAILAKAKTVGPGDGFVLIQKFEPLPMINMLVERGFEYLSEQTASDEYKIYFHRTAKVNKLS